MNYGKAVSMGIAGSGMTKKEVAISINRSPNYIYDVCKNHKKPGLKTLEELAKVFNVHLSTLIMWSEL